MEWNEQKFRTGSVMEYMEGTYYVRLVVLVEVSLGVIRCSKISIVISNAVINQSVKVHGPRYYVVFHFR